MEWVRFNTGHIRSRCTLKERCGCSSIAAIKDARKTSRTPDKPARKSTTHAGSTRGGVNVVGIPDGHGVRVAGPVAETADHCIRLSFVKHRVERVQVSDCQYLCSVERSSHRVSS